jgi:predicted nucleic acid-binding Zn ribbon protein
LRSANRKKIHSLGESLMDLFKTLGVEKKVKQYEVLVKWPAIVGEKIANVTSADKVEGGVLFVKVNSSAWRTELVFLRRQILDKIATTLGSDIITDIRFF